MKKIVPLLIVMACLFAFDVDYDLKRGWNLISIPGTPDATSLDELFPFIPPAYGYNPETMAYTAITGIPPVNAGFWMLVESDTLIRLSLFSEAPDDSTSSGFFGVFEPGTIESTFVATEIEGGYALLSAVVVETPTGGEESKMAFLKTDSDGNILMGKSYNLNSGGALFPLSDGGFLVAGRLNSWSEDVFYGRLDNMGNPDWLHSFSSTMGAENMEIIVSIDGNYIFALGRIVLSTDEDGDLLYARMFENPIIGIYEEEDGDFVVIARRNGEETGFNISRYNSDWSSSSGVFIGGDILEYYSVCERRADGGFIVSGLSYAGTRGNPVIVSVSSEFAVQWARIIDGGDVESEIFDMLDAEDIVLCGQIDSDQMLLSLDHTGELNWATVLSVPGPVDRETGLFIHEREEGFLAFGLKDFYEENNHTTVTLYDSRGLSCIGAMIDIDIADYSIESSPISGGSDDFELTPSEVTTDTEDIEIIRRHICR